MAYSDWQIQRLRERLSAYRLNERGRLTWEEVSEDIASLMGEKIPSDSLRQFVKPVSVKQGKPPRTFPDDRLDLVKGFLTHERIGYLHDIELVEEATPYHAAFALMEFFGCTGEAAAKLDLALLSGRFEAVKEEAAVPPDGTDRYEKVSIEIDSYGGNGLIRVHEVSEFYCDTGNGEVNEDAMTSSGWAAFHPGGLLILFLKDVFSGNVHLYCTMVYAPDLAKSQPLQWLVLLRHDQATIPAFECPAPVVASERSEEGLGHNIKSIRTALSEVSMADYESATFVFSRAL